MFIRKNNRLQGYDYSQNAYYYVTICIEKGSCGELMDDQISLNKYGQIINKSWKSIPARFPSVELDEYIIMPDHIHAIIILNNTSEEQTQNLSKIISYFKCSLMKRVHDAGLNKLKLQKSFNDRIIRNEKELSNIRFYIKYNALKERKKRIKS
jgi:putative transposase